MPNRLGPDPRFPALLRLQVCPCCDALALLLGGRCPDCQDHEPEEVPQPQPPAP